jgi:hypothetical protein
MFRKYLQPVADLRHEVRDSLLLGLVLLLSRQERGARTKF